MTRTPTRRALLALGLTAAATAALPVLAQPAGKPVNLMVPYPAGGLSDAIARVLERPLGKALDRMVIVENLGGVSGALGAQKVLAAPADGGYLYQGSPNELILAPMALQTVKYKPEDFRFVQMIGTFPLAVLARKGLQANTIDELVALARRQAAAGKPLTYGSVGMGSLYHVLGAHFAQKIGAEMTHIPYRGGAPLMTDLAGEQVDVAFYVVGDQLTGMVDQGRLKVLATLAPSGKPEAKFLERYPSINDSKSVKDFDFNTWTGYFVRRDTPEPVVQALHKALSATMGDATVRAQLEKMGATMPVPLTLEQAAKEYTAQTARFRAIARDIKLEAQ